MQRIEPSEARVLSIPDSLHDDPSRPSFSAGGVWVVDYVAAAPSVAVQVEVTRPTLVFLHEGLKELRSAPGDQPCWRDAVRAPASEEIEPLDPLPNLMQVNDLDH